MKPHIHYQVLEIEAGASQDDIKQAYKDLAKVWHPDRFSDNPRLQQKAEEKMKQINAAYEFLKSYQPQTTQSKVEPEQKQSVEFFLNCEKLDKLLELGKLKDADHETKRLLLELAGREKEGWLLPEDVKALSPQALSAIDQLWTKYSNGRFGFSVQSKIWRMLGCESSDSISTQTISENKFAQSVHWRVGSRWLSPWDSFNYGIQAPQGSLPREYIFALSGYWSYSKGWTGYFLLRFDEIFLKL
jgi:hypothetical protein